MWQLSSVADSSATRAEERGPPARAFNNGAAAASSSLCFCAAVPCGYLRLNATLRKAATRHGYCLAWFVAITESAGEADFGSASIHFACGLKGGTSGKSPTGGGGTKLEPDLASGARCGIGDVRGDGEGANEKLHTADVTPSGPFR